jgi:hypothetical protein
MHTYNYLLTTLFIFYASLAYATPESSLKLTSQDAVALALQKNQSLQAARSAINEAGAYSQYAGRLDNPELNLGYASDRAFNDEGEQSYSIGFEQRFPITNRLKLLKNVSAIEVKLAEAELPQSAEVADTRCRKLYGTDRQSRQTTVSAEWNDSAAGGICGIYGEANRRWRGVDTRFESGACRTVFSKAGD